MAFFLRFQSQARVICGRCESSWALNIWTAADVRRYLKSVSSFDIDDIIQRNYRAFVFRCPICGHEAHLGATGVDGFHARQEGRSPLHRLCERELRPTSPKTQLKLLSRPENRPHSSQTAQPGLRNCFKTCGTGVSPVWFARASRPHWTVLKQLLKL